MSSPSTEVSTPTAPPDASGAGPWLIWDGNCGFCCWAVDWARRRGADRVFRIVAYQDAPAGLLDPFLRERARSAVLVRTESGTWIEAGAAVRYVLCRVGWSWLGVPLGWPGLRGLTELAYRWVARNRGRLPMSRKPEECRAKSEQP